MPILVEMLVVSALLLATLPWRDHWLSIICPCELDDGIAVIPAIRKQIRGFNPVDQLRRNAAIRCGTRRDKDAHRQTMRIHGQMDLAVSPPFVSPIASLPPCAPAAC